MHSPLTRVSPFPPVPSRPFRIALAAVVAIGSVLGTGLPAAAWIGGAAGYQTHDWFVDQAVRLVGGDASWMDVDAAREASDDPDNGTEHSFDHVYRDTGIRGGAVHRISEHYAAAVRHYQQGRYRDASVEIGLLSHYYTDILQPYHAHYDGIGQTAAHRQYEEMVSAQTGDANDRPDWGNTGHTPVTISNVRSEAIAAAAAARARFPQLHSLVAAPGTTFTSAIEDVTDDLMRRGVNDLADIIRSVKRSAGRAPLVDRLTASVKWRHPSKTEDFQGVYVTARDSAGRAIEGLEVRLTLPWGETVPLYTDASGQAKWAGPPRATAYYSKQTVSARATTDGHTETGTTWWSTSPTLASGLAGFATSISNRAPVAGETVTVRSTLRDTGGKAVPGIEVTWSWNYGSTTITTTGVTNSQGVAASSRMIQSSTTFNRVTISARTQSGSQNRNSSNWFERKPGVAATPYRGWFVDIWDSKFRDDIVWLADAKITTGCGVQLFCPNGLVTRAQMATFLTRALDLPATGHDYFRDDEGLSHEASINRLAAAGITSGCASDRFCPSGLVTRAQMASFLSRALDLPSTSTDHFRDDEGLSHEAAINRLAESGVTSGCAADRFCPGGIVTRGQMAAFLRRGLTD